jgi:hypothetical protein
MKKKHNRRAWKPRGFLARLAAMLKPRRAWMAV